MSTPQLDFMKDKVKKWTEDGQQHPSEDELLSLLDGELETKRAEAIRTHLEACWVCRARSEKFQAVITSFVEYRQLVLMPSFKRPDSRNGFQKKLNEASPADVEKINLLQKWQNSIGKKLRFFQRQISRLQSAKIKEIFTPRTVANSLTAALILACILTVYFVWFANVQKVSAEELLQKSENYSRNELQIYPKPVVYRQIEINKTVGNETVSPARLELWQDAVNARLKTSVIQENSDSRASELIDILRFNGFVPSSPLSVPAFRYWRDLLAEKDETVDELMSEDGTKLLRLSTKVTESNLSNGKILQTSLTVREDNFHPVKQNFLVKTENGTTEYEVRETSFAVMDLASLKPNFFDDAIVQPEIVKVEKTPTTPTPQPTEIPVVSPSPTVESSPTVSPNPIVESKTPKVETQKPEPTNKITATADLEVEVLQLLNNAKADLGEEITVKRENGILYVRGLVETAERKNEILNSLQSVRQNPAVRIEIQTVAEAVAKQKNQPSNKPTSVENLETKTLTTAAENDLVKHFGSEAEARSFATRTVSRSNQAMQHIYAMRRLARQFSAAELKNLSPEARIKWLNLIASHARNFKAASESLSNQLGSVFNAPRISGAATFGVNSIDDLPRAIENLFAIASGNDGLIRSALTISADDAKMSALRAVQFWQSLKNAEALAAKIASLK